MVCRGGCAARQEEFFVSKFILVACVFHGCLLLANSAGAQTSAPPIPQAIAQPTAPIAMTIASANAPQALPATMAPVSAISLPVAKSVTFAPSATQLLNCSSQEGGISFTVSESFVLGAYDHSGAVLTFEGITYEISKNETGDDQEVGRANIATLFSVGIPNTNPSVFFTIDIPRSQTSLALNVNSATSILMGSKKFSASCRTL